MFDMFFTGVATMLNIQRDIISRSTSLVGGDLAGVNRYREIGEAEQRVIPLAREELQVGKRQVRRAKTYRIRTIVKEIPVEQAVSLRAETVQIERRPTRERPADGDEFHEQTIEVQEMYEEPVVGKVIVQTEEVVVRKLVTERTAVIRDTVRVTDVDVEGEEGRRAKRGDVVLLEAAGDKPRTHRSEDSRKGKNRD